MIGSGDIDGETLAIPQKHSPKGNGSRADLCFLEKGNNILEIVDGRL